MHALPYAERWMNWMKLVKLTAICSVFYNTRFHLFYRHKQYRDGLMQQVVKDSRCEESLNVKWGNSFHLSFEEKEIMTVWWKPWCPHCMIRESSSEPKNFYPTTPKKFIPTDDGERSHLYVQTHFYSFIHYAVYIQLLHLLIFVAIRRVSNKLFPFVSSMQSHPRPAIRFPICII